MWEGALTAAEQKLSPHYGHLLGDASNAHTSAAAPQLGTTQRTQSAAQPKMPAMAAPDAHNRHGPCLDGHQQLDDT